MKLLTRLLTGNFTDVPLLQLTFDYQEFKENGAKNSCTCYYHPILYGDTHISNVMKELSNYIRENYDMEKII